MVLPSISRRNGKRDHRQNLNGNSSTRSSNRRSRCQVVTIFFIAVVGCLGLLKSTATRLDDYKDYYLPSQQQLFEAVESVIIKQEQQAKSNFGKIVFERSSSKSSRSTSSLPILPEACQTRMTTSQSSTTNGSTRRNDLPEVPPPQFQDATTTEAIPSVYIHNQHVGNTYEPMNMILYKNITKKVYKPKEIPSIQKDLPTNITMICIPDGIVVDNGLAGPYSNNNGNNHDLLPKINIYLSKEWFATSRQVNQFVAKKPTIAHHQGLGVQLSGWTGFTHNHFPGDTLIRLGLVYDALMNTDNPLWYNAKIVISADLNARSQNKRSTIGGGTVHPPVAWLYDKLNLTHRLVANNGWLAIANTTTRFDYLVFPDVFPQPKCGPNTRVKDPIFPRHTLRPIQNALGLLDIPPENLKYIVYASRKEARRRYVQDSRRTEIIQGIQSMVEEIGFNEKLEVLDWTYPNNPDQMFDVMSQAKVVVGPHGANLWNIAYGMPPGGLLVEFNTLDLEFTNKDCRTNAFALANAAGLSYALVDTPNFGYNTKDLLPNVEDTIGIIKAFLLDEVQ